MTSLNIFYWISVIFFLCKWRLSRFYLKVIPAAPFLSSLRVLPLSVEWAECCHLSPLLSIHFTLLTALIDDKKRTYEKVEEEERYRLDWRALVVLCRKAASSLSHIYPHRWPEKDGIFDLNYPNPHRQLFNIIMQRIMILNTSCRAYISSTYSLQPRSIHYSISAKKKLTRSASGGNSKIVVRAKMLRNNEDYSFHIRQ